MEVTDSLGNYQLSVGEYSPPLLLKATANGGNQVYYHVVFEPASSKGLRVNINQVTDLLVEQYLHSIQANTNNPLENNFPQIAPQAQCQHVPAGQGNAGQGDWPAGQFHRRG